MNDSTFNGTTGVFHVNRNYYVLSFEVIMIFLCLASLCASLVQGFFPKKILQKFPLAVAVGSMFATTDPIAIILVMSELEAPRRLTSMLGGESLLNDGTSIVMVEIFLLIYAGNDITSSPDEMLFLIFNQLVFSILW